jgi:hypothetical protein
MMLNIRRWVLAAALAACTLPACADPVQAAGPARHEPVHTAASASKAGDDMPEPASLALLGLGVLGLIAFRRKF